jgi:hypothetical protein
MSGPIGRLHPSNAMFMHEKLGEATSEDGKKFSVLMSFPAGTPMIRSEQTGKTFAFSWEGLLHLAIEQGVDQA